MGWPYKFINLSDAEKHARRQALDRYAGYAQLAAFLPVAVVLIYRLAIWTAKASRSRRGSYDVIPDSPVLKVQRRSSYGSLATKVRKSQWWLGEDVYFLGQAWGQRDEWVFGVAWGSLMLLFCLLQTGDDYLHLTKRFGMIAASQFPIQYLLSLKSINPFAFVFRSSHEQLNRYHRVLGRIIYGLLVLHAIFYLNYFIQVGILARRIVAPVVAFGVVAFLGMTLMNTTALRAIRQWSYRLFFIVHLIVALLLPPLLIFHAKPANFFMAEAFIIFVADLVSRKLDTIMSHASLETIPGTNLVKITASVPNNKLNRFREHPGSHIYLSIPAAARQDTNPASASYLLFEFLYNPFTVAAVDDETGDLTLVARQRNGPLTRALARFANASRTGPVVTGDVIANEGGKIPLGIEGPYGVSARFPKLTGGAFDRVLLVSGGVGATFTVPLYRALVHDNPSAKVQLVWAVRGAGDATWAVTGQNVKSIMDDDNVKIFLTGDMLDPPGTSRTRSGAASTTSDAAADSEVEMSTMYRDRRRHRYTASHNRKRPDLRKIVDDAFKHGSEERVAVLFCGPEDMARELREHVGFWVMKGRVVWWHNEAFGW